MTKNDLIHALSQLPSQDLPVRIIQVDDTSKLIKRIEDIEVVNDELLLIIDNHVK